MELQGHIFLIAPDEFVLGDDSAVDLSLVSGSDIVILYREFPYFVLPLLHLQLLLRQLVLQVAQLILEVVYLVLQSLDLIHLPYYRLVQLPVLLHHCIQLLAPVLESQVVALHLSQLLLQHLHPQLQILVHALQSLQLACLLLHLGEHLILLLPQFAVILLEVPPVPVEIQQLRYLVVPFLQLLLALEHLLLHILILDQ